MRKCLGKHSCMSSSFPIVILNDTSFFSTVQLQVHNENPARYGRNTDALVNLNTKLNFCFAKKNTYFCHLFLSHLFITYFYHLFLSLIFITYFYHLFLSLILCNLLYLFFVKLFSPSGIIFTNDEHVFLRILATNLCVLCFYIYDIPTMCTTHYQGRLNLASEFAL